MTELAVIVTVDPECQLPLQLLGYLQNWSFVIEVQLVFEGGEEDLHHVVITAAAIARHAAGDLADLKQLPVGRRPGLAALIGLDQELIWFNLPVLKCPGKWAFPPGCSCLQLLEPLLGCDFTQGHVAHPAVMDPQIGRHQLIASC